MSTWFSARTEEFAAQMSSLHERDNRLEARKIHSMVLLKIRIAAEVTDDEVDFEILRKCSQISVKKYTGDFLNSLPLPHTIQTAWASTEEDMDGWLEARRLLEEVIHKTYAHFTVFDCCVIGDYFKACKRFQKERSFEYIGIVTEIINLFEHCSTLGPENVHLRFDNNSTINLDIGSCYIVRLLSFRFSACTLLSTTQQSADARESLLLYQPTTTRRTF